MSRILVTGANGFVGKHLINELVAHGSQVLAIGGSQAPPAEPMDGVEHTVLNLTNLDEANQIDFTDISGVIHLAGMAAVGPSFSQPMEYVSTNIGIEVNLFEAAFAQKVTPRFIIISSAALYDPKASLPLTEESAILPSSPYAVSKIGQEQTARYYIVRGFECIIARPFNHIGPGQGTGFIVPDIAEQIVNAPGKEVEIKVGNLDAQRDYTDVRDIVRAYRLLLEKGKSGEIYNICSGKAVSGHDILAGLSKAAGAKPTPKQDPGKIRPSDTPIINGSHNKLTADTGWQPEITLDQTLADVIIDWQSRAKADLF